MAPRGTGGATGAEDGRAQLGRAAIDAPVTCACNKVASAFGLRTKSYLPSKTLGGTPSLAGREQIRHCSTLAFPGPRSPSRGPAVFVRPRHQERVNGVATPRPAPAQSAGRWGGTGRRQPRSGASMAPPAGPVIPAGRQQTGGTRCSQGQCTFAAVGVNAAGHSLRRSRFLKQLRGS